MESSAVHPLSGRKLEGCSCSIRCGSLRGHIPAFIRLPGCPLLHVACADGCVLKAGAQVAVCFTNSSTARDEQQLDAAFDRPRAANAALAAEESLQATGLVESAGRHAPPRCSMTSRMVLMAVCRRHVWPQTATSMCHRLTVAGFGTDTDTGMQLARVTAVGERVH